MKLEFNGNCRLLTAQSAVLGQPVHVQLNVSGFRRRMGKRDRSSERDTCLIGAAQLRQQGTA